MGVVQSVQKGSHLHFPRHKKDSEFIDLVGVCKESVDGLTRGAGAVSGYGERVVARTDAASRELAQFVGSCAEMLAHHANDAKSGARILVRARGKAMDRHVDELDGLEKQLTAAARLCSIHSLDLRELIAELSPLMVHAGTSPELLRCSSSILPPNCECVPSALQSSTVIQSGVSLMHSRVTMRTWKAAADRCAR